MAPASTLFKRDTCYNRFGSPYNCNNYSYGARVGTGIAVAAAIVILIIIIGLLGRRRRMRQASNTQPVYTTQPTQNYNAGGAGYAPYYGGQSQGGATYGQQGTPQGGANQGYGYPPPSGGQAPYSPPAGPPPQENQGYAAPAMPPPSYQKAEEK